MLHRSYEMHQFDHIVDPDEIDCKHNFLSKFDLLRVTAIGRFKEGARFTCFHSGFSNFSLRFTTDGHGKLLYRDRTLSLERGDVVFTDNLGPQRLSADDAEWSFFSINLVGPQLSYYEELWNRGGAEIIHTEQMEELEALWEQVKGTISHADRVADLEINLLLTRMLTMLLVEREQSLPPNERSDMPEWVYQAADAIAAHCGDAISLDVIAKEYFVNRAYFSRQFKRYMGLSPKEYQMLCRLEKAVTLLQETDYSVAEIAGRSGFSSQSLFAKMFYRQYGQTPGAYRRSGAKK